MPRPKAPYFPLYAQEFLCDPKILQLTNEEIGVLVRLWSWMWINDTQRGTLLVEVGIPMTDEIISKLLGIGVADFQKVNQKLTDQLHILKRGKDGELYSKRMRNHKTKYELYHSVTETKRKRKGNETEAKSPIREGKVSKGKISKDKVREVKEKNEGLHPLVELFNSTCISSPKIKTLSKSRIRKIQLRLKENPLDWWKKVFEEVEATPFLKGENKNGWKATLDWLIDNDKNALKVYEGNYKEEKFAGIKAWAIEQEEKYGQS